jgi:hypothetical protein
MLIDLFNQAKEKVLDTTSDIHFNISSFLVELETFFNQPKFNSTYSKDIYNIDRFINDNTRAILINQRDKSVHYVLSKDLPTNAKDVDYIKIENGEYVLTDSPYIK